jgi:hypothetical protein
VFRSDFDPKSKVEAQMFKFVGWLIVTGFAAYGLVEFIEKHVVSEKPKEQ